MSHNTRWPVVLVLFAIPALAQTPGRPLHREIPGGTALGELPQQVFAASSGPGSLDQTTRPTGWNPRQLPPPEVFQPRGDWETPNRELDRHTRSPPNAELSYREVFTPSVSPFKRAQVYDAVDELGRLGVRDPSLRVLTTQEAPRWQRGPVARFTGDVLVRLSAGAPTPLPSVAAEERLVSFETSPAVPLVFLRDSAGGLYVRGLTDTVVRLTYVLEAPQWAFVAPRLPAVPLRSRLEGTLAPQAPGWIQTTASAVLSAAGVREDQDFATVLSGLTGYFRAFRDEDLPGSPSNNLYRDLALGRVGACRHRAYALVLTLHALGVPARYVNNEAHAWAEVAIPELGWTRVDLGGWNVALRTENPSEVPGFVPANTDPLPRPLSYGTGYSAHGGSADGGARDPEAFHERPSNPTDAHERPGDRNPGEPSRSFTAGPVRAEQPMVQRPGGNPPTESTGVEILSTTLTLSSLRSSEGSVVTSSVRGSLVVLEGEARDERDEALSNLPVEVVIQPERGAAQALGTTVTDAHGHYRAQVLLPASLSPGDYALRVRSQGDSRHAPAISE